MMIKMKMNTAHPLVTLMQIGLWIFFLSKSFLLLSCLQNTFAMMNHFCSDKAKDKKIPIRKDSYWFSFLGCITTTITFFRESKRTKDKICQPVSYRN